MTGFIVSSNFLERAMEDRKGRGYWKFDGTDTDCEGEFVDVTPDEMCEKERDGLYEQWMDQKKRSEESRNHREFIAVENEITNGRDASTPPLGADPGRMHSMRWRRTARPSITSC